MLLTIILIMMMLMNIMLILIIIYYIVPSWGPDHPKPELSDGLHHQDKRVEIYRVGEFT